MDKLCLVTGLLLDYISANRNVFLKPVPLFAEFAKRVHLGTISAEGDDPSGLFWLPRTASNANQLLSMLSEFSDNVSRKYSTESLNPWIEATTYEQMMRWAAWSNKSEKSFLGHTFDKDKAYEVSKLARQIKLPTVSKGEITETNAFSDSRLMDLLFVGFINPGQESSLNNFEKYDWRGICITLLMNGGGLRDCECFQIWVHDIQPDPIDPGIAYVRVFHPTQGAAPNDFTLPSGRTLTNRAEYLALKHPGYPPRNKAKGAYHAGWKNPKLSNDTDKYLHVHWFPKSLGKIFLFAWKMCLAQRMSLGITAERHPFLFVSYHDKWKGEPYTIDSFREAHARAIRRIGLTPAKRLGTTEHGHRHAYGQRAAKGDLGVSVIQSAMHHRSPDSQAVYTAPSITHVNDEMVEGLKKLGDKLVSDAVLALISQ
jgi:hypothetical protein